MAEIEWNVVVLDKIKARARVKGISKRQAFRLGIAAIIAIVTVILILGIAAVLLLR